MIRRAFVKLTEKDLKEKLNIPKHISITAITYDVERRNWKMFLEGGNLPEIPELGYSPCVELKDVK